MRWLKLLPLLLAFLFVGACDDIAGLDGRSLDGEWTANIEGETLWMSLRDDGREVYGSGEWGFDEVYVTGERVDSEIYLLFEFDGFNPIELEGTVRGGEIDGRLYGSGFNGERVRFYRD